MLTHGTYMYRAGLLETQNTAHLTGLTNLVARYFDALPALAGSEQFAAKKLG
jgi:hypothetical protein